MNVDLTRDLKLSPRTVELLRSADELQYARREAFAQVPRRETVVRPYPESSAPLEVTVDWARYPKACPAFEARGPMAAYRHGPDYL